MRKIVLLGLLVAVGALITAPAMASTPILSAIGGVSTAVDTAFGGSVAFRLWSASQVCPGLPLGCINANTSGPCQDVRCPLPYDGTASGGYLQYSEDTVGYSNDADNQTVYELTDANLNPGASNHIAYYAVQGGIVSNGTANPPLEGDPYSQGCPPGVPSINCLELSDSRWPRTVPLGGAKHGYPAGTSIASIGGLSPVPNVRVGFPGPSGPIPLSWDNPDTFAGAMKGGPTGQPAPSSPVKGVRVYVCRNQPCSGGGPLANDPCWTPLGSFDIGTTSTSDSTCPTSGTCNWYATTVRLTGPGGGAMEVETGREIVTNPASSNGTLRFVGVNSQPAACGQTAVLISSVTARYAGRGNVNVNWTTSMEPTNLSGFYVSRATSPSGPFTRVSPLMSPTGGESTYLYTDKARTGVDRVIYYQIEALVGDQVISSGPTAVTIQKGNVR